MAMEPGTRITQESMNQYLEIWDAAASSAEAAPLKFCTLNREKCEAKMKGFWPKVWNFITCGSYFRKLKAKAFKYKQIESYYDDKSLDQIKERFNQLSKCKDLNVELPPDLKAASEVNGKEVECKKLYQKACSLFKSQENNEAETFMAQYRPLLAALVSSVPSVADDALVEIEELIVSLVPSDKITKEISEQLAHFMSLHEAYVMK